MWHSCAPCLCCFIKFKTGRYLMVNTLIILTTSTVIGEQLIFCTLTSSRDQSANTEATTLHLLSVPSCLRWLRIEEHGDIQRISEDIHYPWSCLYLRCSLKSREGTMAHNCDCWFLHCRLLDKQFLRGMGINPCCHIHLNTPYSHLAPTHHHHLPP